MVVWTSIKINEQLFIVKFVHSLNKVACHLSDFQCVWREILDVPRILERAKEKNPLVEYSEKIIIDTILSPAIEYQLNQDVSSDNDKVFRLKYYVSSLPFLFYWNMVQCSSEIFFEDITRTLLISLIDSQRKNAELVDVIRRKDVHIDQYQAEGAVLIRKQVATPVFNHDEFTQKFTIDKLDDSFIRLCEPRSCDDIQTLCKFSINDILPEKSSITKEDGPFAGGSSQVYKSPNKNAAKRLKKDLIALRKFQPKTDAKFVYDHTGDEDDESVTTQVVQTEPLQTSEAVLSGQSSKDVQNPINKDMQTTTHSRKIRKKLNL